VVLDQEAGQSRNSRCRCAVAIEQTPGLLDDLRVPGIGPGPDYGRKWLWQFGQPPEEQDDDLLLGRRDNLGFTIEELLEHLLRSPTEDGFGLLFSLVAFMLRKMGRWPR
jgi:hypothetical protein